MFASCVSSWLSKQCQGRDGHRQPQATRGPPGARGGASMLTPGAELRLGRHSKPSPASPQLLRNLAVGAGWRRCGMDRRHGLHAFPQYGAGACL